MWNPFGIDHSIFIPHGIHDVHGIRNWLGSQPTFIPWIPYGIPGDSTDAVPGGSQAMSGTETHPALVKLSQTKSFRIYGLKQVCVPLPFSGLSV